MNNLLLIFGMIALSNGNISLGDLSLFDNKNKAKSKGVKENIDMTQKNDRNSRDKTKKVRVNKKRRKKNSDNSNNNSIAFSINDINKGLKLMDLSDEDLERGMEIITRTKKYMSQDERKFLVKIESVLDLVRGIKKLSSIEDIEEEETNFFRCMDEEDKKNMMIREILEVFPEKRKESIEKAIDMKKKIDLFAELFLPDDIGENGFSISSLASLNNLGSMNNLKLLGSLLRVDDDKDDKKYYSYDSEYDAYDDFNEDDDDFCEYIDDLDE